MRRRRRARIATCAVVGVVTVLVTVAIGGCCRLTQPVSFPQQTAANARAAPTTEAGACVRIPIPAGPEDLVPVPGHKAILVSTADRALCPCRRQKPLGQLVRIDLARCHPDALHPDCAKPWETVFPRSVDDAEFADFHPVGLDLVRQDGQNVLWAVDSSEPGTVVEIPLDARGQLRRSRDPRRHGTEGDARPRKLNAIERVGSSVLGSNATASPPLSRLEDAWAPVDAGDFRFANGIAAYPVPCGEPGHDPVSGDCAVVFVNDFGRGSIQAFRASADGSLRRLCTIRLAGALPDNLHWELDENGVRLPYLLVATFDGSLASAATWFLGLRRRLPGSAWRIDVSSILAGDEIQQLDCERLNVERLVQDERSFALSGASVAQRVDDLLVIGQLRNSALLVCPWPSR